MINKKKNVQRAQIKYISTLRIKFPVYTRSIFRQVSIDKFKYLRIIWNTVQPILTYYFCNDRQDYRKGFKYIKILIWFIY